MPAPPIVLRHPDPWGQEVVAAIKQAAWDAYPLEACGVVTGDQFVQCENTHPEPDKAFRIDPGFTAKLMAEGKLQAVVHSHPDGPAHPSEADARAQIDMGVPWGLVSVIGDITEGTPHHATEILWWGDDLPDVPLLGRKFIWHIFHCYQLYRDWWWQNRGIRFATYPCSESFIQDDRNVFIEHVECTHHVNLGKVDPSELQIGDMLVGRLRGRYPNHCGVYVGDDTFMHHPPGGASCTTNLQRWWPHIDTVLRHDGTQNPSPLWKPSGDVR